MHVSELCDVLVDWQWSCYNIKERVYWFCGTLGISQDLSVHLLNDIHNIEGNHLLHDMKEQILFST